MPTAIPKDRWYHALLGWLIALAACYPLAWWGLAHHLDQDSSERLARYATGWRWDFDSARDLVGRTGTELDVTIADGRLSGSVGATPGFVSLAFRGDLLDARRYNRLQLAVTVDRPTTLLLFHRERLDGAVLGTRPIELDRGSQRLEVDLAALPWTAQRYGPDGPIGDPTATAWGGAGGVVASIRVHPATTPGARFEVESLWILPAPPCVDDQGSDTSSACGPDGAVRITPGSATPERVLADFDAAVTSRPSARWDSAGRWPLPPPEAPLLLAVLILATLWRQPAWRRTSAFLAALVLALTGLLLLPPELDARSVLTVILASGLAAASIVAIVRSTRKRGVASPSTRFSAWLFAALLPLVTLGIVLLAGLQLPWSAGGEKLARYLPWALLQQALLQLIFVRALGGHDRAAAIATASALFGWLHWPNFALMVLSSVLALLTALHFRRHRAILPVAIAHALAGTIILSAAPPTLLRSGLVGLRYFGSG